MKLKQDAANNNKFPNMIGCFIFLQVLYLDSLCLEEQSLDHKCFPRVKSFTHEKLRAMIATDNNYRKYVSPDDDVLPTRLRDLVGCIYSWATDIESLSVESSSGIFFSIWEAAVAMVHLLNIPIAAAGPVFVAAADFQTQLNAGLCLSGVQPIKLMSALVSIMTPYSRVLGFIRVMSWILPYLVLGFLMPQYRMALICFLHLSLPVLHDSPKVEACSGIDLNVVVSDGDRVVGSSVTTANGNFRRLPSPWDLGYCWPSLEFDLDSYSSEIDLLGEDDSVAIIHRRPRYLHVFGHNYEHNYLVVVSLVLNCLMPWSGQHVRTMIICILDMVVIDGVSSSNQTSWKSIVSGSFQALDNDLRQQLSVICPAHDFSLCKLFFFSALIQCRWVCFVWASEENVIYVFEPSYGAPVPASRPLVLERSCYRLKLALQMISESLTRRLPPSYNSTELCLLTLTESVVSPIWSHLLLLLSVL